MGTSHKEVFRELGAVNVAGEKEETVFPRSDGHSGEIF
jgi:hypothetical protein